LNESFIIKARPAGAGSALVVALWVILLLSLLISSFAFDMHVEADITAYHRRRVKAHYIAQSGMELAQVILTRVATADPEAEGQDEAEDALITAAVRLARGVPVEDLTRPIGEGLLTLSMQPEEGRRYINNLTDEDWEEILDQANVPEERWPELIDGFLDFTDEDELRRLHGAESDDSFYTERGYPVKNAQLDTVDELLLIKGFDEELVFGSPPGTPPEEAITGIATWLTAWSHGRVNLNTASPEVLLTLPDIDEWAVEAIVEHRLGLDGEPGTRDEGFQSLDEAMELAGLNPELRRRLTVGDVHFIRVTAVGEVGGVRSVVWGVFRVEANRLVPVYWREQAG
jgi:general secretion pathway protein K